MKLHTPIPHDFRMCLSDLGSKDQGHNALITENGLCCIIPRMCPIDFGQKVQGQGHNAFITKLKW